MKPMSKMTLRHALRPKILDVVRAYLLIIAVLAGSGGVFACILITADGWSDVWTIDRLFLLWLAAAVIMLIFGMLEVRRNRIRNYRKELKLAALADDVLIMLADEISQTELRYGTFYFLEEYVYFPHAGELIRYQEITDWKTTAHYTMSTVDHVWVEITETDGFSQRISIRRCRRYHKDAGLVKAELLKRKCESVMRHEEKRTPFAG